MQADHSATLPAERAPRPKSDRGLTGKFGRPERPTILALEGHVEEIVILKDDQAFFRRTATSLVHLIAHAEHAIAENRPELLDRVTSAMRKLARAQLDRSTRLQDVLIPEVQACYLALEAATA